jgi:hypothetical protein
MFINLSVKPLRIFLLILLMIVAIFAGSLAPRCTAGAIIGPGELDIVRKDPYRVLEPIESGKLTIFPVILANGGSKTPQWQYITLDEGLKSGEVVVTEAGRAMGLVRPVRPGGPVPSFPQDDVNRLVLMNHSSRPLILLAGEIVTGGKQDRVIAKDRIVPAASDPIDLSVFCIEPGRWVASSAQFGAAGRGAESFMVQPTVRRQTMAAQDQQSVWSAVGSAIHGMNSAVAGTSAGGPAPTVPVNTTSYAKAMLNAAVGQQVDTAGGPALGSGEQLLEKLRRQHAVGVVVAVHGEIVWADIFANTELLEKYWTKLIRSYAAEAITSPGPHDAFANTADAQHFLDATAAGHETSEGEAGVYRYIEVQSAGTASFVLESLLPGTGFDVHISKVRTEERRAHIMPIR